jgi:hypothetical protein
MENRLPEKDPRPRSLAGRLDRAARDMNAFLLVLAIGLATLDLTCLWAFKMRDALPTAARSAAASAPAANKPSQSKPAPNGNASTASSGL